MICELEINEKILVYELKNGNVKAFDLLFNRYYFRLYEFSLSILKNKEDARDIVQDTFFKLWEIKYNLDPSKSFRAFLFAINYHMIINLLRTRIHEQSYKKHLEDTINSTSITQENRIDIQTIEKKINSIVEKLPERRKRIYFLSRQKGLTHKEIAIIMGISSKTVENQINLTLKYVKSKLSKEILSLTYVG